MISNEIYRKYEDNHKKSKRDKSTKIKKIKIHWNSEFFINNIWWKLVKKVHWNSEFFMSIFCPQCPKLLVIRQFIYELSTGISNKKYLSKSIIIFKILLKIWSWIKNFNQIYYKKYFWQKIFKKHYSKIIMTKYTKNIDTNVKIL